MPNIFEPPRAFPGGPAIRQLLKVDYSLCERNRQRDERTIVERRATAQRFCLDDLPSPNLSLVMSRYLPEEKCLHQELTYDRHRWTVDNPDDDKRLRMEMLRDVGNSQDLTKKTFDGLHARRKKLAFGAGAFPMVTDTRLVVGFGNKNTAEMGLTVHPLYGFPVIPGSSLKGVARRYLKQCGEFLKVTTVAGLADIAIRQIGGAEIASPLIKQSGPLSKLSDLLFGPERIESAGAANEGALVFYDAWPADFEQRKRWYGVDIMNPHYADYYMDAKNETWPGDYLDPTPLQFLCVEKNVKFEFLVGLSRGSLVEPVRKKDRLAWRERSSDDLRLMIVLGAFLLRSALGELGVGAKRAADYGFFRLA